MDDSSDIDNSLTDLHHGLDSSFDNDEHTGGLNKQESSGPRAAASMDVPSGVGVTDDQMIMLQDMVLEMKEGFKNALKELAKIQDKEEGETYHSRKLQQQQQRQLDDLTETIHEIKDQLSSLTKSVKQIKDEQKTIKDHLEEVRSTRDSSQESKPRNEKDRLGLVNDLTNTEEWNTKLPELPADFDDHTGSSRLTFETDDNEVTVTACKSLILAQALSDKCLKMNISQSSDDEDEELENRRMSYYTPKIVVSGRIDNRRHSMPSSALSQGKAKDVGIAAQRQKAVKELADLEREYCAQLWSLLHTYLTPLQTAGFLNARELGTLFPPYLDQLYAEHCQICSSLQDRLAHWTYLGTVADLLARITDSHSAESILSLYKEYVDDLLSAVMCLRRIQAQSSKFRSFLKAVKHSSYRSEDLMSLLLAPVQHMPKYLLQLQQVFHYTPTTHSDFPLLQASLCRLQSFVDQMNEELSATAEVLNQDRHIWSSGNSGQMLNARDSGVHSNSTEDDNVMPSKSFSKAKRSHVLPEWLDDSSYGVHDHKIDDLIRQRHGRSSASRLSALSQPDLTVYNNMNSHGLDPSIFAHMPRSQSSLPTGIVESGDEVARGRQYRKVKIRRRNQSPVDYTTATKGHLHRSLSPQIRPSSAIDFLSHSHLHQHQHQNNYRDPPVQLRKFHYAERHPRPHTVLGQHVADVNHKPTIISRKHIRRSQPPIPASTNFWAEMTTSSALPFRVGHQRLPLSARDLLPKRPLPYTPSDVLDGDDEQDEDDTRASDTHSLGTNGSHPYSSGQGSNHSHDIELELYQGHTGAHNPQMLKPFYNRNHSPEFSSAEVTASLARKLYDVHQVSELNHEGVLLKEVSNQVSETKMSTILPEQSSASSKIESNKVNGKETVKENYLNSPNKDIDSSMFANLTKSKHVESEEEESLNSALLTNKSLYSNEESITSFSQVRGESLSPRSNSKVLLQNVNNEDGVNGGNREDNSRLIQFSESNRRFLQSLSTKSQNDNRQDLDTTYSINSSREIHSDNWTPPLNKRNQSQFTPDSSTFHVTLEPGRPKGIFMSLYNKNGSSDVNESSSVLNGNSSESVTPSSQLSYRQSQPVSQLVGSRNCDRISPEVIVSTQKNRPVRSRTLSSITYNGSLPPTSSYEISNITKANFTSLDSHQPLGKQNLLRSSAPCVVTEAAQIDQATTDFSQMNVAVEHINNHNNLLSYPDSHELPPLELDDPAPDSDNMGRKGDIRKKMKDGGKFNSSDGLSKAIDDPVNARKKMHFKSSIKNLFSKKKGQVILADVEREVVKQMTTAADSAQLSKSKAYFRKTKAGSIKDSSTPQKTVKEETFEPKNWKGDVSNASLMKSAKKCYFDTKQSKSLNVRNKSLSECDQYQQQQGVLHFLQAHNKRHGLVVDSKFHVAQDVGSNFVVAARQDSGSKDHSQNKNCAMLHQHSQQKLDSDSTDLSGTNLCNKSAIIFDKPVTPKHYQGQTAHKEQAAMSTLDVNEVDPLKLSSDIHQNKLLHINSKDITEYGNTSKTKLKTKKFCNPSHGDFPIKKSSHFNSHDLCHHCQRCEMRQRDKVVSDCPGTIGISSGKSCGPEYDKKLIAGYSDDKSQISNGESTCRHSSNTVFSNHNEGNKPEKVMQLPLAVKPISFTECLRPPRAASDSIKIIEKKNSSETLTNWQSEQLGDRCKRCSFPAVQYQATTSLCQQHQSSIAAHNMPDVTKISKEAFCFDQIVRPNYLTEMSQKSCIENVVDLVPQADTSLGNTKIFLQAGADIHNNMERNNSSVSNSSLTDNLEGSMSLSPEKLVSTSSSPTHYFTSLPQIMCSESRPNFQREHQSLSQIPRPRSTTLPKTFPDKDCSESFVMEETHDGVIVKRFSLEGQEFSEHKYCSNETNQQKLRRSENPKSLKALSASSVIAENFKQLPRSTHLNYNKNCETFDQPALYLTLPSPSGDKPETNQQANNPTIHASFSDSLLTGPRFLLQSSTGSNKKQGNSVLIADNRSFCNGLLATSHEEPSVDNDTVAAQKDHNFTNNNARTETSSDFKAFLLSAHHGLKGDETSLKHVQTNKGLNKDGNASVVTESASRLSTSPSSSNVPFSDESSSYKPKNPVPVTNLLLSGAMECQSSRPIRYETPCSENQPLVSLEDPSKQHCPSSDYAVSSSILDLPPKRMSANYESHRQMASNDGLRAKNDIRYSDSYPRQQSGNGSLYKENHGFLGTNSPSDFFSIRPYVDYTASKASSDSGILVHLNHVRSSTPKGMKSSKGSSSEKLDKSRKHTGNKKTRGGSEKNSKCCKNPNKCTENINTSDDVESCQSSYQRRSRHSDGAKFSVQEEKCYQAQYPRYSVDSSSLISNAFLQKMANLSKPTIRSVTHSQVDDSHMSSPARHPSIHEDLSRKGQCSNGVEATTLPGTNFSRSFRITASAKNLPPTHSAHVGNDETPQVNYENRKSRNHTAKADITSIQAGPDLLLLNDGPKEEASAKEKSPLSKKAQSFFSKLTHSPISLFYRDSKSPNPPK